MMMPDEIAMPRGLPYELSTLAALPDARTRKPREAKPKRKAKAKIPPRLTEAMTKHKRAYMAVFKREPSYEVSGEFVRIDGKEGVNYKRLKTLTDQLRERMK